MNSFITNVFESHSSFLFVLFFLVFLPIQYYDGFFSFKVSTRLMFTLFGGGKEEVFNKNKFTNKLNKTIISKSPLIQFRIS